MSHKFLSENKLDGITARISRQPPLVTAAAFTLFWGVAYMTTNHFPLRKPSSLFFMPFEASLPFLGWTVLVYLSAFPQAFSVIWLLDRESLARLAVAAGMLVALHAIIFTLFPTTYPRPADVHIDRWPLDSLYQMICRTDTPGNCFPSLHVSVGTLIAMCVLRARPILGRIYIVWSLLVAASTLTTKQHYALDAIGGAALAVAAYFLLIREPVSANTDPRT